MLLPMSYIHWHEDEELQIKEVHDTEDDGMPFLIVPLSPCSRHVYDIGKQLGYKVTSPGHYRGDSAPMSYEEIGQAYPGLARGYVSEVTIKGSYRGEETTKTIIRDRDSSEFHEFISLSNLLFTNSTVTDSIEIKMEIDDPSDPKVSGNHVVSVNLFGYVVNNAPQFCFVSGAEIEDSELRKFINLVSDINAYYEADEEMVDEAISVENIYFAERLEAAMRRRSNGPLKVGQIMDMFDITPDQLRGYLATLEA